MKCNLNTVNGWCGIFNKSCKECISPMCEFIKKAYRQGRVEAEYFSGYKNDWIPFSDDSTAPNHEVICQDRYGNMMLGYAWVDEQGVWVCEDDNIMMDDVVAWRPKPKPYKENKE